MFNDLHREWAMISAIVDGRRRALDLFERCLAERNPRRFEIYIEDHIAQDPPPVALLLEIADSVRGRVTAMQIEYAGKQPLPYELFLAQRLYENVRDWSAALSVWAARSSSPDETLEDLSNPLQ